MVSQVEPRIVKQWLSSEFASRLLSEVHSNERDKKIEAEAAAEIALAKWFASQPPISRSNMSSILQNAPQPPPPRTSSFQISQLDRRSPLDSLLLKLFDRFNDIMDLNQVIIRIVRDHRVSSDNSVGVYLPLGKGTFNGIDFNYRDLILVREPTGLHFMSVGLPFYLLEFYQASSLEGLPAELKSNIGKFLPLADIQKLRATSSNLQIELSRAEASAKKCGFTGKTEFEFLKFARKWENEKMPLECLRYAAEVLGIPLANLFNEYIEFRRGNGAIYSGESLLESQFRLINIPVIEYVLQSGLVDEKVSRYFLTLIIFAQVQSLEDFARLLELSTPKFLTVENELQLLRIFGRNEPNKFRLVLDHVRTRTTDSNIKASLGDVETGSRRVLEYVAESGFIPTPVPISDRAISAEPNGSADADHMKLFYNRAIQVALDKRDRDTFDYILDLVYDQYNLGGEFFQKALNDTLIKYLPDEHQYDDQSVWTDEEDWGEWAEEPIQGEEQYVDIREYPREYRDYIRRLNRKHPPIDTNVFLQRGISPFGIISILGAADDLGLSRGQIETLNEILSRQEMNQ